MLNSLAKLAATLNMDRVANTVVEKLYSNSRTAASRFSRRFQVLGYHKVSRDAHPFFEPMDPATFEQQMQFLKSCYRVMSLQELVDRSNRGDVPERAVAVTFDDGYRDNYEFAFPILQKYQIPATIFVATGAIGTGELIWHDRVFDAFRYATVQHARLQDPSIPPLKLQSNADRLKSLESVLLVGKTLHGSSRLHFIDDIETNLKPKFPEQHANRMLNWNEVREMSNAGIDFGSHTVSHTILSRLPREEMIKELRESRRALSENLGRPIPSFAYPNGKAADYNEEAKSVLKECGYSYAVTCQNGFNSASSDQFALRRGLPWQKEIQLFRVNFFLQRHGLAS